MKKVLMPLIVAPFIFSSISCTSPDSGGRRYYHSPAPIDSKKVSGLTFTDPRPAASPLSGVRTYSHSPAPISSKTGLQVAHAY
jgi:hypothetical protein